MTINEYINDFLRDAQYRVGTLSTEIDELEDEGSTQYNLLFSQRLQLTLFMDIVYEGKWYITNSGYNHIQYSGTMGEKETWTEKEVIQEIEYLRYYTSMNEVPFINFTGHYPQIVNGGSGVGNGGNLPAGVFGQTIFYNLSNNAYAEFIDPYAGLLTGESINSYFANRT